MPVAAATSHFAGFSPKALTFFRQLEKNNDRAWFTPRKANFDEHVYGPMLDLVARLRERLRKLDADYAAAEPKRSLYRIYRDTRFSKDKTPYKLHLGAQFQHRQVPKNRGAGLYVHVCHKEVCVAGGVYMPGPDELTALRQAFVASEKPLRKLLADRALAKQLGPPLGDSFARVPKGFEADISAADLVRRKQLYFSADLPSLLATTPKLEDKIFKRFETLLPLVRFLNNAILAIREDNGDDAIDAKPRRPDPMF